MSGAGYGSALVAVGIAAGLMIDAGRYSGLPLIAFSAVFFFIGYVRATSKGTQ